jgi:hypothetical protein
MKNPGPSFSLTTFLVVFSWDYWMLLFLTTNFGIASLICFTTIYESNIGNVFSTLTDKIGSSFIFILIAALNLDVSLVKNTFCRSENSTSSKTFLITLCVLGYLNLAVYQAGLTSSLTQQTVHIPIKTLDDLLSKRGYSLILTGGSSDESYFSEATEVTNAKAKEVWDVLLNNNPKAFVRNGKIAQEQLLLDDNKVFFASKHDVEIVLSYYPCMINTESEQYSESQGGFPFRKGSPYQKLFKQKIINIVEYGTWKYARNEAERRKQKFGCSNEETGYKPMGYLTFFSLFIATGMVIITSICVLIGEFYFRRRTRMTSNTHPLLTNNHQDSK